MSVSGASGTPPWATLPLPPQECQNSAFDLVFWHDASKFNSLIVLIPEGCQLVAGG